MTNRPLGIKDARVSFLKFIDRVRTPIVLKLVFLWSAVMARKLFDLLRENDQEMANERLAELSLALEHHTYQNIPGTRNSYRMDSPNTNTRTERHAHVYAKPNGNGKELYSVNMSGKGHDGYTGACIPAKHANFFRDIYPI